MVICFVSEFNFTFPPPAFLTSEMTDAKSQDGEFSGSLTDFIRFGTFVTGEIGGVDDDGVGGFVNVQLGTRAEVVEEDLGQKPVDTLDEQLCFGRGGSKAALMLFSMALLMRLYDSTARERWPDLELTPWLSKPASHNVEHRVALME